jgi:hypothetical protein
MAMLSSTNVVDVTSENSTHAAKKLKSASVPEVVDLSFEEAKLPTQSLTPETVFRSCFEPFVQDRKGFKARRRNFLPNSFQAKHDELYKDASSQIAGIHRSNHWHYQQIIDGIKLIDELADQACAEIEQNSVEADAACQKIDTDYVIAFDKATPAVSLLEEYSRICSEHSSLDKSCKSGLKYKFSHLVCQNDGDMHRIHEDDYRNMDESAHDVQDEQIHLYNGQDPVTETPQTPKRPCPSLEMKVPGAPSKRIRRGRQSGRVPKTRLLERLRD